MVSYSTIAENPNSTVVAEYIPDKKNSTRYQSENELEREFVRQLETNGYKYLNITKDEDLRHNLRAQLASLNDIDFSQSEWQQILDKYLVRKNEGIKEKTNRIQRDHIFNLKRDDGSTKNIRILDKDNIHKNNVQGDQPVRSRGHIQKSL